MAPRAILGAGGSILKSVILTLVVPLTLIFLSSTLVMTTSNSLVLVTPLQVMVPLAPNLRPLSDFPLGVNSRRVYSMRGFCSAFMALCMTVSIMDFPLLSWRTGMMTLTLGVTLRSLGGSWAGS